MTDDELKQLVESNARAIQAMLDARVGERLDTQATITRLEDAILRLTTVQEGVVKILASLDEDRPTVFRKLTSIETKVDQVLRNQERDS